MSTTWFRRMGDIPGLDYEPPVPVDRGSLPGHDSTATVKSSTNFSALLADLPEEARKELGDLPEVPELPDRLTWTYPGQEYGGSASPAKAFERELDREASSTQVLEHLWKTLELPGEPVDYHFALQNAVRQLWDWKRRRREPELVEWVEWVSLLNLRLVKAHPEAVWFDHPGTEAQYVQVLAFGHLRQIYEAEGFLPDALDIAKQAAEFDQMQEVAKALETRLIALQAEDEH
jgi:hypothetical protein